MSGINVIIYTTEQKYPSAFKLSTARCLRGPWVGWPMTDIFLVPILLINNSTWPQPSWRGALSALTDSRRAHALGRTCTHGWTGYVNKAQLDLTWKIVVSNVALLLTFTTVSCD